MDIRGNARRIISFLIILSFLTVMFETSPNVMAAPEGWDNSPTLLDTGSGAAYNSQIAMDNNGNAMVVWQQVDSSRNTSILANRYSAGVWGGVVWLEAGAGNATSPQVAMSSNGNAMVVWQQVDSSGHVSILANRYSAGVWGGAVWLEAGTGDATQPQIAMDNDGNAMVVWQQVDNSGYQSIMANRYSAGVWGGATLLEDSTNDAFDPQVTIDSKGNAMVAWIQVEGFYAPFSIYSRCYSAGAWEAITWLSYAGSYGISLQIASGGNGDAIVVWGQKYMSGPWVIFAMSYSDGIWGEARCLGGAQAGGNPQVAMDGNGNAIVVWKMLNDPINEMEIYSMRFSAGVWETETILNSAGGALNPQVAIDSKGNAMAVWQQGDNLGQQKIYAKRFFSGAITPDTVSSKPILSSAKPTDGKVNLVWTEPASNGGSAIDYYVIYQDGVALTGHQVGLTANIVGLINGQEYTFTVAAHNLAGMSAKSNAVSSIPNTVPDAPTGLVGVSGDGQVTLNWTKPVFNGGRAIDYYIVYQDGVALPNHPTGLSTTIVGLVNGHSYSFTVSANNLAGIGPKSTAVTITPSVVLTVPGAPADLSATPKDGKVSLGWSAPISNGGSAIDYYIVYQSGTEVTRSTSTSVDVTGLVNEVSYRFNVAAHNTVGTGPQSSSVSATPKTLTSVLTVPDPPTGLTATPGNAQISLTWTKPVNEGGAIVDYYLVYQNGNDVMHPTGTSATITGLTNGQMYAFSVAAHNSVGNGAETTSVSATPNPAPSAPGSPTGLTVTPGDSQVSFSWSAPGSDGGATIDYYLVYVNGVARSDRYTTVSTAISGLINGQQYTFTVAAHNSVGIGAQSTPATTSPSSAPTVPGAPSGLGAIPGNGRVTLSWIAPSNNGGAVIDYYQVYVNGIVVSDHFSTTSTTITGLINDQQYSFTIAAHNSVGAGAQSMAIAAMPSTVTTVPGVPTGLTASPGNGQVTLSWAAPTSNGGVVIDYYVVYQDGIEITHPVAASVTINGLTNGHSYDFTVAAHNWVGTGVHSLVVTVTPISGAVLPGIPTGLTATAGVGKVTLSWTAPAGSTEIDYYIVYQNGVDVEHVSTTSTIINELTNGEGYSFAVAAHGLGGVGPQSSTQSTSPIAASPNNGATTSGIDGMTYLAIILGISLAAIIAVFLILRRNRKNI
jgi:hypothetical protein